MEMPRNAQEERQMLQRALDESRASACGMRRPRDRGKRSKKRPRDGPAANKRGRPRKRTEPESARTTTARAKRARTCIEPGLTRRAVARDVWAACDVCHAWRRLPEGVAPPLEEEEWDCSRGFIVAGGHGPVYHTRCAVPEEGYDEDGNEKADLSS